MRFHQVCGNAVNKLWQRCYFMEPFIASSCNLSCWKAKQVNFKLLLMPLTVGNPLQRSKILCSSSTTITFNVNCYCFAAFTSKCDCDDSVTCPSPETVTTQTSTVLTSTSLGQKQTEPLIPRGGSSLKVQPTENSSSKPMTSSKATTTIPLTNCRSIDPSKALELLILFCVQSYNYTSLTH